MSSTELKIVLTTRPIFDAYQAELNQLLAKRENCRTFDDVGVLDRAISEWLESVGRATDEDAVELGIAEATQALRRQLADDLAESVIRAETFVARSPNSWEDARAIVKELKLLKKELGLKKKEIRANKRHAKNALTHEILALQRAGLFWGSRYARIHTGAKSRERTLIGIAYEDDVALLDNMLRRIDEHLLWMERLTEGPSSLIVSPGALPAPPVVTSEDYERLLAEGQKRVARARAKRIFLAIAAVVFLGAAGAGFWSLISEAFPG